MRNPFTPKRAVAGLVAAAVVVGAVAAAGARSDTSPSYRTATASVQEVDQVLHTVATVEPVSQASVAFPVDGTVEAVDVSVGDTVAVGRRLATLDVADLLVTVNEKQAALDQANLTLELALAGEDVGSVSGGSREDGFSRPAAGGSSAEIKAAQQAVLDAQEAVDESTAAATLALENAATVCASTSTDAQVAAEESTTSTAAATTDPTACLAALQAVQAAQQQVSADQAALAAAADALTALLDAEANNPTTPTTTTPVSPSVPDGSDDSDRGGSTDSGGLPDGSTDSGSSGGSPEADSGSTSPSAEDLIAYQKKVDAAEDELAVAEQAVDQATIVSPIAGTVASVGLAVGDDVTAGSSTQNVVIVGKGGFEVTTSISVKDLPDVEVGQAATVLPDGDHEAVAGEVVRIGVTGDSSGSTTTYPVTIALTGDTSAMGNGSTASVEIVTAAAEDALAVPTSAVTVDGDRATVQVVTDGKATTKTVETGAVGATWTEITEGLSEGDEVVLADLDEPLPGSATESSTSGTEGQVERQLPGGGTFTFPGGGAPPSGMRPGD